DPLARVLREGRLRAVAVVAALHVGDERRAQVPRLTDRLRVALLSLAVGTAEADDVPTAPPVDPRIALDGHEPPIVGGCSLSLHRKRSFRCHAPGGYRRAGAFVVPSSYARGRPTSNRSAPLDPAQPCGLARHGAAPEPRHRRSFRESGDHGRKSPGGGV